MLKVAVTGVGAMGRNHARVYSEIPGVALVAVADANEAAARAIGGRYNARPYADFSAMLAAEQPDAVSIAVPTVDHLAVVLEALSHGCHVLVEKPIAFTVEEARRMIAEAERRDRRLMVGHVERFNPAIVELKKRMGSGELGRIFQVDAHRQGPFPARVRDVGVVIDLAVHDLDVMRYITDCEVLRVYAETERRIHSQYEDLLTGLVRLENGIVGTLAVNWLTPAKIRELYVTGELGMFRVDYLTQDLYFYENALAGSGDWETMHILRGVTEGRMIRHVVTKKEPLRAELEAFLAAAEGGAAVPVTGSDGLAALELAQALVASGLEHRAINLPNDGNAA